MLKYTTVQLDKTIYVLNCLIPHQRNGCATAAQSVSSHPPFLPPLPLSTISTFRHPDILTAAARHMLSRPASHWLLALLYNDKVGLLHRLRSTGMRVRGGENRITEKLAKCYTMLLQLAFPQSSSSRKTEESNVYSYFSECVRAFISK